MLHPIYYMIMLLITIGSYLEFTGKQKQKIFYIFICIILIIIAGIRVGQGPDYWPYLSLYLGSNEYISWTKVFDRNLGLEPTYVILSKILGSLQLPFTVLLFTFAAISVPLKAKTFYDYSPLPFLALLFYYMPGFFFGDMGQLRQGLVANICMFSFRYITNKKLYKYLICMYIAYLTHKTAMIFIPAYWIANMRISTVKAFFIVVLGVVLWPMKPYLILGDWLNSISTDNLATESFNSYGSMDEAGFGPSEIIKIVFLIILFANDRYILKRNIDDNYMKVRNLVIMYFFIYYAFHGNAIFSIRLPGNYGAFDALLVTMIVAYSRYKTFLYVYFVIYLYLLSYRFWESAQKLEFDKFNNIFNDPRFSIYTFTPHIFYQESNDTKELFK